MKPLLKYTSLSLALVLSLLTGCDKQIELSEDFKPVTPADVDADAGTWDMIVLSAPTQIVVAAPTDVTSDAYKAELTSLKDLQTRLDDNKRNIIEYWSAGGVLRWNQIMRELVAKYNLPPAPDGWNLYPVPDAENPFADPSFPFANPPYSARAYSYVSVGMYEALKSAWHYKYLYNRPSPYKVDSDVQSLMPETDLPAYPSEDAVMSGVAVDMLKALFPAALEEITTKATEQRNAALWSGRASSSDITAGYALGKAVAAQMMARASTDGMRFAVGTKADWQKLAQDCIDRGENPWISQESPARPPMLPLFGNVKAWNMTPEEIVAERPVAPPSTSDGGLDEEAAEVKYYTDNLTRERLAIVHKWADGAGTYTPPGHWNDIATEYIYDAHFSEVRAARAYALLNMTMHDAAVGCWNTKFYYFNPRPSQVDPSIKTCTGLPNFPAYTSGHSTFSGAASVVLSHLFPQGAASFAADAEEASLSRLYGGIHYRSDIEMGMAHGIDIASYTVNYALSDGAE